MRTSTPTIATPSVSAILVCHNGARWLPTVVAGLHASTLQPDAWSVVDTGSEDSSAEIVRKGLGVEPLALPSDSSYGAAVEAALAALPPARDGEWVWLLHDDSTPAAGCLEAMVDAVAEAEPELAAVGPKLREWPSLRRLLEVGVTMSGTGRRETGLEPGEYDQGQHDEPDAVLAVNTAGMLIRRDVLEQYGFASELPLYGNDVDLGWRLARSGRVVRVVPEAVVFHAEAAHRGQRRAALAANPHRDERVAAMFTVLVNGSARAHPVRLVRLFLGGLLRALGFLLVRDLSAARAEVSALAFVYGRVRRMRAARRRRRREAQVPDRAVRPLLAPVWMPWRHGLDFVIDLVRAILHLAVESLERRRSLADSDRSLAQRAVRSPAAWTMLASFVVALVAERGLLAGAPLHGGALLPTPSGVGHWWGLWADSWHWVGPGTSSSASAFVLPLAMAGSILFGQPALVVWLLFCMTVPLAYLGALRFFRRLTRGAWASVWGAAAYALLPITSGLVSQGRLGAVAAAIVLPWVATAALGLGDPEPERRWRAAWRTALALGLLGSFVPVALLVGVVLAVLAPWIGSPATPGQRLVVALGPLVLVLPWWQAVLEAPGVLVMEAGRVAALTQHARFSDLLAGSVGGPGTAPPWLTWGIGLAALAAFLRVETRGRVLRAWVVAVVAAITVAVLSHLTITLPAVAMRFHPPTSFPVLLMTAALITAGVIAADGALRVVSEASFGWRQPLAAVAVVAALVAPIGGTAWWLATGHHGPLHRSQVAQVPAYMTELAQARHDNAALVVRGGPGGRPDGVVEFRVVRSAAPQLGDDGLLAVTTPDAALTNAVSGLLSSNAPSGADVLASHGIAYVFARAPVSSVVAGAFDASSGFATASAPDPRTRAWRVVPAPSLAAIDATGSRLHPLLVVLQVLAILAGLVLAAPSRPVSRSLA